MKFEDLIKMVSSAPLLKVFATASKLHPNVTADDVLKEISSLPDAIDQKFDLMAIHKSGRKKSIGYDLRTLEGGNGNYTCICPFHGDTSEGSLVITVGSSKNLWKCFACGEGHSPIDFEMKYFNLKFKDAVYHLASRMGYIQDGVVSAEASNAPRNIPAREVVDMILADEDVIHNVYRSMQELFPLSEAHKKHLRSIRSVHNAAMVQYFSFPSRDVNVPEKVYEHILKRFCENFYNRKYSEISEEERKDAADAPAIKRLLDQMKYVPGFYLDKASNKLKWIYQNGLALMAIDDQGKVIGIQVQNMNPLAAKNGRKYIWWSSGAKLGERGVEGGSSPGSPGGVIFPSDPYGLNGEVDASKAPIVITEGKYKAEALSRMGRIAVYVSGVGTWRSIIPMVERLRRDRQEVYLAFDADSLGNSAVNHQLKELSHALKEIGLETIILTWSKKLGKGFDDLLHTVGFANFKLYLKAFKSDLFEFVFESEFNSLLSEYGVDNVTKLPKESKQLFAKTLQERMEVALELEKIETL